MCALRNWILGNIEEAVKDVEECAIQASIVSYPLMDVLAIRIATFVSTQLVGLHIYPLQQSCTFSEKDFEFKLNKEQEQVKKLRRLVHLTELLFKVGNAALIRVWSVVVDTFTNSLFQTFCKDMICRSYSLTSWQIK